MFAQAGNVDVQRPPVCKTAVGHLHERVCKFDLGELPVDERLARARNSAGSAYRVVDGGQILIVYLLLRLGACGGAMQVRPCE